MTITPTASRARHWPFQDPAIDVQFRVVGRFAWPAICGVGFGVLGTLCGVMGLITIGPAFFFQILIAALVNVAALVVGLGGLAIIVALVCAKPHHDPS